MIIGRYSPTEWQDYDTDDDQISSPIQLKANTPYYLEVRHAVGVNGSNFVSVGVSFPSNKIAFPITEKYLVVFD